MLLLTYARLYHWYGLPLAKAGRVLAVVILLGWAAIVIRMHGFPATALFLLSLLAMAEIIYRSKLQKIKPVLTVARNVRSEVYQSSTLPVLDIFLFAQNTKEIVKSLLAKKHIQFILKKSDIFANAIPLLDIDKETLLNQAFSITKTIGGTFVTTIDIFGAYMLLIEPQTKILFNAHLKPEEFLHIVYWARVDFPQEEFPPQSRVVFWGEGVFDSITTGWTVETQKYINDLTYKVLNERPTLLGRRAEFQEMVATLERPRKNSVMLIGETGTGKTSLVEALALNSYLGFLPGSLYHQRIYELLVGPLVSGAADMGTLETRLEAIIEEVGHAGNIILFIPELQNIVGSSTFKLDLSGALLPHLRSGKIRLVTGITPGAYKQFVQPQQSFTEVFDTITIEPVNRDEALQMLLEQANDIEKKEHVAITFKAVVASVDLAMRFMQDRALPGSAVTLLSSVASIAEENRKNSVTEDQVTAYVEQKTHGAIAVPGLQEKETLLHLEEKLHQRIIGQDEAINAIAQAIRRVRSGLATQNRPISFLFLGPTGVGKTETAKALAKIYFGGEGNTVRLDMSEYTSSDAVDRLLGAAPGRGSEKGELTEKVYEHPFSLILLDEFEKAHPEILDLFLQVFEDGRLTDNHGKLVAFSNTIIIATSNAGALYVQQELAEGKQMDKAFQQGLISHVEQEHIFKPELLNRFDGIIVFKPLREEDMEQIAKLYLSELQTGLLKQDIQVTFDEKLLSFVARQGFDPQFGARPLRRYVQDTIEDMLSKKILEGNVARGSKILLSVDDKGQIQVRIQ